MAINTSKVLVGGLAAGVAMNIFDYVLNGMIFGERMTAEMNAFKPGMGDAMGMMDTKTIVGYIIMDLGIGMLLAYTYAAMRPRFGAGAKTAIITAMVFWIFGSILTASFLVMGMMSTGLWWSFGVAYLICLIIASLIAGALYSEDSTTATA
ncbi:MAG TPA: hypothetical protein VF042_01175 [Gemmatimonadaceae bacterium]